MMVVFVFCLAVVVSGGTTQDRSPRIAVGPNILVSKDHPEFFHGELWFTADPGHAQRLMGGSMAYDVAKDISYSIAYVSVDGGITWQSTLQTGESVDPACAYGPDGTAYFLHLDRTPGGGMEIYRSKDGGKTWLPPVVEMYLDREYMVVDNTPGKFRGRIYVNAHASGKNEPRGRVPTVFYSADGGDHFSDYVSPPGPVGFANPGNGIVMSDGTFASVFMDLARTSPTTEARSSATAPVNGPRGFLGFVASTDGGQSLSAPLKIADWTYPINSQILSYLPELAVDRSKGPFQDRLYVVWTDTRSGRGEIYLSWSSDHGRTWSSPRAVNDDAPRHTGYGPDNLHASVVVNNDGIVAVSWYDRRDTADNKGWKACFAASLDGGITFTPSVVVSEVAYEPTRNQPSIVNESIERTVRNTGAKYTYPRWPFVFNGGDTSNTVADAKGDFHIFWTDNRTGTAQVWTSVVRVAKPPKR